MKRLEKLIFEKKIADCLSLLPFQMRPIIENYYQKEIDAIQKYGSDNPEVDEESLKELKRRMEEYDAV